VAEDFKRAFGDLPAQLGGIALASDTDNTGERARAGFAEFRFVSRDETCAAPDPATKRDDRVAPDRSER